MSENTLPPSIGFDACKTIDRPSQVREAEPAGESQGEVDPGQEEPDCFAGDVESEDELEPVIRMKKRQRKSQTRGNVFQSSCLRCFGLKLFEQSALVRMGITKLGSIKAICESYS